MLILTIRTDKPEAEIGLFSNREKLAYEVWYAHRELSVTILSKIDALLKSQGKTLDDVDGIVGFAGPGSFTGLRIGLTVANTLAYGLQKPVLTAKGEDWTREGIKRLENGQADVIALPEYGAPARITQQRK